MPVIHSNLVDGRWHKFSLVEQLGNIGSDVDRSLRWYHKGEKEHFEKAFDRALDLFDLTLADPRWRHRLKEICRAREVFCDYFFGGNQYGSTADSLSKYFYHFALAARAKC